MPEEIEAGTPETVDAAADSNASEMTFDDYELSFPLDESTGERKASVRTHEKRDSLDEGDETEGDTEAEQPSIAAKNASASKAVKAAPSDWESRYKDQQSYSTKIAQQNSEFRERLAVANRDIEYLVSLLENGKGAGKASEPTPEEWQETVNSKEKFDGYLAGPVGNSLMQAVMAHVQEYLSSDPVYKESAYKSSLEKAIAIAESEGVDIRALKPEIAAVMKVNRKLDFENAYKVAKELAAENGKAFKLSGTKKGETIQDKAKRLNIEQNRASGQLGRNPKKIRNGSIREILEDSLDDTLSEFGLL